MSAESPVVKAGKMVRDLYAKYEITDPTQAKRLVRDLFSQEDYDTYKSALKVLDGSGAIG